MDTFAWLRSVINIIFFLKEHVFQYSPECPHQRKYTHTIHFSIYLHLSCI